MSEELDLFRVARRQFNRAVPFIHPLEGWRGLAEMLFEPERVIKVSLPVVMDDGFVHNFRGYRVLHDTVRGPGKGGFRFHPDVDEDEVKALAEKAVGDLIPEGTIRALKESSTRQALEDLVKTFTQRR